MSILGRILAILGLIVVGIGILMPVVCPETQCKIMEDNALFDVERFENDTDTGIQQNLYGLLAIVVAVPLLIAIISGSRGTVFAATLALISLVVVTALFFNFSIEDNDFLSLSWGWGVLGAGSLLLLLSSLFKAARPVMSVPAMAAAGVGPNMNKTMIDIPGQGRPVSNKPPGIFKTMIDAGFGRRSAEPPAPAYPQYGAEVIDPLKKTMVEGLEASIPSAWGGEVPDPSQATMITPANAPYGNQPTPATQAASAAIFQERTMIDLPDEVKKTMIDMNHEVTPPSGLERSTPPSGVQTPLSPPTPPHGLQSVPPPLPTPQRKGVSGLPADLERTNIVPVQDNAADELPSPSPLTPAGTMDPAMATMVPPPKAPSDTPKTPPANEALFKTMIDAGDVVETPPPASTPPPQVDPDMFKTMIGGPIAAPPKANADLYKTNLDLPSAPTGGMNEDMFKTMIGNDHRTPPPISKEHDLQAPPDDRSADDDEWITP